VGDEAAECPQVKKGGKRAVTKKMEDEELSERKNRERYSSRGREGEKKAGGIGGKSPLLMKGRQHAEENCGKDRGTS